MGQCHYLGKKIASRQRRAHVEAIVRVQGSHEAFKVHYCTKERERDREIKGVGCTIESWRKIIRGFGVSLCTQGDKRGHKGAHQRNKGLWSRKNLQKEISLVFIITLHEPVGYGPPIPIRSITLVGFKQNLTNHQTIEWRILHRWTPVPPQCIRPDSKWNKPASKNFLGPLRILRLHITFCNSSRQGSLHLWPMRCEIHPTVNRHQWSNSHCDIAQRSAWQLSTLMEPMRIISPWSINVWVWV